jgi:hypothetical protein
VNLSVYQKIAYLGRESAMLSGDWHFDTFLMGTQALRPLPGISHVSGLRDVPFFQAFCASRFDQIGIIWQSGATSGSSAIFQAFCAFQFQLAILLGTSARLPVSVSVSTGCAHISFS